MPPRNAHIISHSFFYEDTITMAGKKPKPVAVSSEKDGSPFPDFDINENVTRGTMPEGIVSQECLSSQAALGTSLRVHSHSQQRASPPNSDPFPLPTAPFLRFKGSSFNPSDHSSLCMTPTPSLLQRSSTFGYHLGEVTGTGCKPWDSSLPPKGPGFYKRKVKALVDVKTCTNQLSRRTISA
jgi:hypothetical protein